MRFVFVVGSLVTGGAERQATILSKALAGLGCHVIVMPIFPGGYYGTELESYANVSVQPLYQKRGRNAAVRTMQLAASPILLRHRLKVTEPTFVYSMLHAANLIAWAATRGKRASRLIWGYRASNMRLNWKRLLPERLCALVSKRVPLVIANSQAGRQHAEDRGFRPGHMVVVPNGIDTEAFCPSPERGAQLRSAMGLSLDVPLVGIAARLDPMKGHETFLAAAAMVMTIFPACRFLCVGDGGRASYKDELNALVEKLNLSANVLWLGHRKDMVAVYNALDVLTSSSSYGEGFPNVIGEAMACGTPCVATDVGDAASVVGDTGLLVPPKNAEKLAAAIEALLMRKRDFSGLARDRIKNHFSVDRLTKETLSAITAYVTD